MTLLRSGSATDTGLVRSSNQDLALETASLFAVADGMGGHAGGEVAAQLAVDTLGVSFGRQPTGAGLAQAVAEANGVVWQRSQDTAELRGMGTTLTALALVNEDGADVLALVNVGDSRSYRFHQGELSQITSDHSLAEEMVRAGELSASEAAVHPHRHILTRALGVAPEVSVDLWKIQPVRGDRYLLCSDGLTNEIDTDQMVDVLGSVADPEKAAEVLVRAARTHGGSDNITVVVVDVVVGEGDEDDAPSDAVAAMSPDFATSAGAAAAAAAADGAAPAGTDGTDTTDGAAPAAAPPGPPPTRRERRRAKRRAKRVARGRRLVTLRTLIFVVVVAAVVAGGLFAVRWYDTNSFFVKADGNELVIYQGRIGGFLWYNPTVLQRTGVTTADIPQTYLDAVRSGVEEESEESARAYVANLVAVQSGRTAPTTRTTAPGAHPATTVPATTVPATTVPTTAAHGGVP